MLQRLSTSRRLSTLPGLAVIGFFAVTIIVFPASAIAQRGQNGRSESQRDTAPPPQRTNPAHSDFAHARREVVQTRQPAPPPRYVPPPALHNMAPPAFTRPIYPTQRPAPSPPLFQRQRTPVATYAHPPVQETPQGLAQRTFTHTSQGRRYDNGIQLRHSIPVQANWQRHYFPRGRYYYTDYCPSYNSSTTMISPFAFYFGICAPFILRAHCDIAPPEVVYIDVPIFVGDTCQGYAPIRSGDNILDMDALRDSNPGLANAVDELREAFGREDIDALVTLMDPDTRIAVFERGQYQYSLAPNDFVDMARDAFQSTQTVAFDLTRIHQRADGVYVVSGEHVYRDGDGHTRQVYVSYVLEDIGGAWTLTQVGTAPDHNQAW